MCAISRPDYSYQASLLRDICNATSAMLHSGWKPSHTAITGNELADYAADLAAEGVPGPLLDFPWSYSHLRTQIRRQLPREWQAWHRPRDDFPFSPSTTKLSAGFSLPRHAATRLLQVSWLPPTSWATPIGTAQTQGFARDVKRKSRQLNTLYFAVLLVSMPGNPIPRPWTSGPPGMTPLQLKCSPSSSAALSLPILRDPSPPPEDNGTPTSSPSPP